MDKQNMPSGDRHVTIPKQQNSIQLPDTTIPRTGTNRPNMPRKGKHVTVPCNRFPFWY